MNSALPVPVLLRRPSTRLAAALVVCAFAIPPVSLVATQGRQADTRGAGLKVRGHWVLEVLNPDGTAGERREFDNALTIDGQAFLSSILSRTESPGLWSIVLENSAGNSPCSLPGVSPLLNRCTLHAPQSAVGASDADFLTLAAGITASNQIVLTGNITAGRVGSIDTVETWHGACGPTISGSACRDDATYRFTAHTLNATQGPGAPLVVAAGQIVQVSVTISFCSSTGCQS